MGEGEQAAMPGWWLHHCVATGKPFASDWALIGGARFGEIVLYRFYEATAVRKGGGFLFAEPRPMARRVDSCREAFAFPLARRRDAWRHAVSQLLRFSFVGYPSLAITILTI